MQECCDVLIESKYLLELRRLLALLARYSLVAAGLVGFNCKRKSTGERGLLAAS